MTLDRSILRNPFFIVLPSLLAISLHTASASQPSVWRWRKLPIAPGRADRVSSIGVDTENTLWMMAGNGLYYYDGSRFQRPSEKLRAGQYLTGLYGGPDRGLYCTQPGDQPNRGKLYHLQKNTARYVTDFHYESRSSYPNLYISRMGHIINASPDHVRILMKDSWMEFPVDNHEPPFLTVLETSESLHFFKQGVLYTLDRNMNFTQRQLLPALRGDTYQATVWRNDCAIIYPHFSGPLSAFHLPTGNPISLDQIAPFFRNTHFRQACTSFDGSVYIFAHDQQCRGYKLYRIAPYGSTAWTPTADSVRCLDYVFEEPSQTFLASRFMRRPDSPLIPPETAIWFGFSVYPSIVEYNQYLLNPSDHYNDQSPAPCKALVEDLYGKVYAASDVSVQVLEPLEDDPNALQFPFEPTVQPPKPLWSYPNQSGGKISEVHLTGESISLIAEHPRRIVILNSNNGQVVSQIPLPEDRPSHLRLWPTENPGRFLLNRDGQLMAVDTAGSNILPPFISDVDHRIAPIPIGTDYLVTKPYRGAKVSRVTPVGESLWSCELRGYLMATPTTYGATAIIQTRSGSYGGQATTAVDLHAGEIMWSDTVNAYGSGVAFADDAEFLVESDTWLSPQKIAGWLIARNPKTGEILWKHERFGTTIQHTPVIDTRTNRTFAVFDDGTVVCLEPDKGELVWQTTMQDGPVRVAGRSYDPYWPGIVIANDLLVILDRHNTLYFFDTRNGRILVRLEGSGEDLIAQPWIHSGMLITATKRAVTARSLRSLFAR